MSEILRVENLTKIFEKKSTAQAKFFQHENVRKLKVLIEYELSKPQIA